jgi:hypothetical protein
MSNPNPYQPPSAELKEIAAPQGNVPKYIVIALVAIQLLATMRFSYAYLELVRTGAAPVLALLFGFPASICLYVAALFLLSKKPRGKRLFLVAAVGLAVSVRFWGWPYPWSVVALFGAVLGAAGWWVARGNEKNHASLSAAEV